MRTSSCADLFCVMAYTRLTWRESLRAIEVRLIANHWAPFHSTKGAVKLHTLLNLRGAIPTFISVRDGKLHEVNAPDFLPVRAGAFYVMDRGNLDFVRLYALRQVCAFFVTRGKCSMTARRVDSAKHYSTSAVPAYILIAIAKKELQLNPSLYTLLQIVSLDIDFV